MKTLSENENPQVGDYRIVENEKGFYIERYVLSGSHEYDVKYKFLWLFPVYGLVFKNKGFWKPIRDYTGPDLAPGERAPLVTYNSLDAAKEVIQKWKHNKETYPKYYYL